MGQQKNVVEDIAKDLIDRFLYLKFDICKCSLCNSKMLRIVSKKFPPYFADPQAPDYKDISADLKDKYLKRIVKEVIKALDYVNKNPPHKIKENKEGEFSMLLEKIYQERGLDFNQYHRSILKRRVALRLRANNLKSYAEYLRFLTHHSSEYEKLFEVLTINLSDFFRDPIVWVVIKDLLTQLLNASSADDVIKIWSAGTARGEEAYSLAMIAKEVGNKGNVEVYGTDVDGNSISNAIKGEYSKERIRNVSKERLEEFFEHAGKDKYVLKNEIKEMTVFKQHNLIKDTILHNVDIIVCRNVFIYFTKPLQEQVLNKFYNSLKDGGYLIIGRSETIPLEAKLIFDDVDSESRVYRKISIEDS